MIGKVAVLASNAGNALDCMRCRETSPWFKYRGTASTDRPWLAGDARPWPPDAVNVLSDKLVFRPQLTPVAGCDLWHP